MALDTGEPAPIFALPTTQGATLSLADLKGRKVVVFFYPKDDTSSCTREAQDFDALRAAFDAAATVLVGISPDSLTRHEKFKAKYKLGLTLAADESREAIEAYGLWVEKKMYGLTYMGVERTTILIDREGRIAKVWPKVRVPGHAAEVLEATKALG